MSAYELLRLFLLHFATLFPLVNPFDTVPLFLAVTKHSTPEHRALTARRAVTYATIMMLAALLLGHTFLLFIGVSIAALRVAGRNGYFHPTIATKTAMRTAYTVFVTNRFAERSMFAMTRRPSPTTPGSVANLLSSSTSWATARVAAASSR